LRTRNRVREKKKELSEIESLMANEDDDGEKSRSLHQQIARKPKTQIVIGVPSYQEVLESSQTKSTPPSLFKPSQSFSQAFAFVKSSDVYSPPPPSSAAASSSQPSGASQVPHSSSQTHQTDGASSSSTPVATGSVPSNTTQNRNAILVSHRQVRRLKPPWFNFHLLWNSSDLYLLDNIDGRKETRFLNISGMWNGFSQISFQITCLVKTLALCI
jgi:DNA excision repair protein ERCC-1